MSQTLAPDRVALGPDSLLWRYAGDTRIGLMGATIGLLQLAYPSLGQGVIEHSDFFDDPMDRVVRSLPRILGTVYDDDGGATGIEVRDFHKDIKGRLPEGERYHALDPHTFWPTPPSSSWPSRSSTGSTTTASPGGSGSSSTRRASSGTAATA